MSEMIIHIGLAFLEGLALIVSPCILPVLPLILTGSLTGNKSKPVGIIIGFIISFTLLTLFSKVVVQLTHLNPDTLRYISYSLLILFGIVLLSSTLTDKFNLFTQRLTRVGSDLSVVQNPESGLLGGIIFGGLIGVIWTPCAGPILAAVIVQSILQETTWQSLLVVLAFAIGAGIPMLLIATIGRNIIAHLQFFKTKNSFIRKLLGLLIIASVFVLMFDTTISLEVDNKPTPSKQPVTALLNGLEHPYQAPTIDGIEAWLNTKPLTQSDLKGKVILVDFWTYSCINCIRTLPYLIDWYAKYHAKGFEIIGVHSPEFEFEKNIVNVTNAVKKFGILYPVALDNHFVTWQNFKNQYWPAHYLIDQQGRVVYQHFGEGEYDVTENNIRYLLDLRDTPFVNQEEKYYSSKQTPEIYLGTIRAENIANTETFVPGSINHYHYPSELAMNRWALQGKWLVYKDKIVSAEAGASIKLRFFAGTIFAVMGVTSHHKPILLQVKINSPFPALINGHEGPAGKLSISRTELYTVASLKQESEGIIELIATEPGLEMYTFTFGG